MLAHETEIELRIADAVCVLDASCAPRRIWIGAGSGRAANSLAEGYSKLKFLGNSGDEGMPKASRVVGATPRNSNNKFKASLNTSTTDRKHNPAAERSDLP